MVEVAVATLAVDWVGSLATLPELLAAFCLFYASLFLLLTMVSTGIEEKF